MSKSTKVLVVGGGPIGALSALYAARRGCNVELYDLRDDPNYGDPSARPDIAVIPLALSERGIRAIAAADTPGLLEGILDGSRPIYTRMVHTKNSAGEHKEIPMTYGPQGQCLHTIQREKVTKHVMLALLKEPNVKMIFNQRLVSCDLESNTATFESVSWSPKANSPEVRPTPESEERPLKAEAKHSAPLEPIASSTPSSVKFDFMIGADGTYSTVRQSMMRHMHMDYSQEYVSALWCDFIFPAGPDGDYPLDSKCLHVWPADQSIVMAQPDFNCTFRAGMVCDTDKVRHFEQHPEEFAPWFANEFPGIVPNLLTPTQVTEQFLAHQKIPLKSIKTGKLGYKDKAVLLGDSSHAMTPFHAMGMITGLEDVRIFFEDFRDPMLKNATPSKRDSPVFCAPGTVHAYESYRLPDVHAMVEMASDYYHELRMGVRSPAARAKKIVEAYVSRWVPALDWNTAYARIQFGHERFTVVRKKEER